jgi:glycine oxidase
MPVVAHQRERDQPHAETSHRFLEYVEKRPVIPLLPEDGLLPITAIDNVVNAAWSCVATRSGHVILACEAVNRRAVRYDRRMAASPRVGIVGGGIIGCAIAYELADRGAAVTVFDARAVAGGATQASAGILAPYIEGHEGGPLFDLAVSGLAEYDAFVARVRSATDAPFEYRRIGTMEVANTEEHAATLRARVSARWAATAGLRWLDPRELRQAAPFVQSGSVGALTCSAHGYVSVLTFTEALADAARRRGARIHTSTPVDRIEIESDAVVVHAVNQSHHFDRVVMCAGAWTPSIDPFDATTDRIKPIRGQLVRLQTTVVIPQILWSEGCYLVPWTDGTVLVGATAEDVGFDERATSSGVRTLLDAAEALVPELSSATFMDVRVGLRPASSDGLPLLSPATHPRVLYATGHFRNGVLLAPLTARLIADYVF